MWWYFGGSPLEKLAQRLRADSELLTSFDKARWQALDLLFEQREDGALSRKEFVDALERLVGKHKLLPKVKAIRQEEATAAADAGPGSAEGRRGEFVGILNKLFVARAHGARVVRSQAACCAKLAARELGPTKLSRASPSPDDLRLLDGILTNALERKHSTLRQIFGEHAGESQSVPDWVSIL